MSVCPHFNTLLILDMTYPQSRTKGVKQKKKTNSSPQQEGRYRTDLFKLFQIWEKNKMDQNAQLRHTYIPTTALAEQPQCMPKMLQDLHLDCACTWYCHEQITALCSFAPLSQTTAFHLSTFTKEYLNTRQNCNRRGISLKSNCKGR
jgi:hypothetical protein